MVTECHENELSWEKQKQTLGLRIFQLAKHAEEKKSKQGTIVNDGDDIDTGNDKSTKRSKSDTEDWTKANISAPKALLELAHYILSLFTDEQLQREELDLVLFRNDHSPVISFVARVEFQQELGDIAVHEIHRVMFGSTVYSETNLHKAYDQIQEIYFPASKIVQRIDTAAWSFFACIAMGSNIGAPHE